MSTNRSPLLRHFENPLPCTRVPSRSFYFLSLMYCAKSVSLYIRVVSCERHAECSHVLGDRVGDIQSAWPYCWFFICDYMLEQLAGRAREREPFIMQSARTFSQSLSTTVYSVISQLQIFNTHFPQSLFWFLLLIKCNSTQSGSSLQRHTMLCRIMK